MSGQEGYKEIQLYCEGYGWWNIVTKKMVNAKRSLLADIEKIRDGVSQV